jgi:hypothetical protein
MSASDPSTNPALPFPIEVGGVLSADDLARVAPLAAQILADPVAMRQLSDRVFELMCRDLKAQRERYQGYGR